MKGIPGLLDRRAAELGSARALVGNDGTGVYRSLTFAELRDLADGVARALAGRGDPLVGRRVCWLYGNDNGLVAVALYHAVARLGAVGVPINPGSTAEEVGRVLDAVGAAILIAPPGAAAVPDSAPRVDVAGLAELSALAATAAAADLPGPAAAEEPAVILFTSGTTGRSKGVVHSHASAIAAGRGWAGAFGLTEADTYQAMYPVYAGSGLHFSGLACVHSGSTFVIDETRPTSASLDRVDAHGTTVYAAVPSIYQYWLQEDRAAHDLSTLRMLDFGGAVMHRSTIEALRRFVPGVELVQTYGLTEAGPGGLYLPGDRLDEDFGSIGSRPIDGLRHRLDPSVAPERSGDEAGEIGELQFAGDSVMLGYLDDPAATDAVFDGEWLRTGDLVRIAPDGAVYFLDRIKDLIVRGGFNISSIEIEEALLRFAGVREVAAFGYPHEDLGEVVAIAVVPEGDLDLVAFRAFAVEHLARVTVPERIAVLDRLPLTAAGKVQKAALRTHPDLVTWEVTR